LIKFAVAVFLQGMDSFEPQGKVTIRITPNPRVMLGTIEKVINNLHYDGVVRVMLKHRLKGNK